MTYEIFSKRYQTDFTKEELFSSDNPSLIGYDLMLEKYVSIQACHELLDDKKIEQLTLFEHPNVQQYQNHVTVSQTNEPPKTILITEDCNLSTFHEFLKTFPDEQTIFSILKNVLNGLVALHEKGIFYGCFSIRNVLLHRKDNGEIVAKLEALPILAEKLMTHEENTIGFLIDRSSPEVGQVGQFSAATDVWAFGAILYEMFSGELPLDYDDYEMINNFQETIQTFPPIYKKLVKEALKIKTHERASSFRLLEIMKSYNNEPILEHA